MNALPDSWSIAAHAVLADYGLGGARCESLGSAGGFSGSFLWRVQLPHGDWCLKAWPAPVTAPDRITRIHQWMTAARMSGLGFVPQVLRTRDGATWREAAGRIWDIGEWMPGRAEFSADPSAARLHAALEALAQLHREWRHQFPEVGPCTAVHRRLDTIARWQALVSSGWRPQCPPDDPLASVAWRVWRLLPGLIDSLPAQLAPWRDIVMPLHPCLGDVWHDHVLFVGDHVTGIIDYGAARIDTPAVDLARLLGSLTPRNESHFDAGLRHYQTVIPMTMDDIRLVHVLDRSGTILGAANWLRWLYYEGRDFDRKAAGSRLESLAGRMEAWSGTGERAS